MEKEKCIPMGSKIRKEKLEELKSYINEMKTLKRTKLSEKENTFLNIEPYQITLQNGESFIREKLVKGNHDGSAVIIVPVTKEKMMLLAVEPRVFTEETVGVGFPAGYLETGEDALEAARRELLEETGYESKNFHILDSFYQDEGCSSAYNTIVLATGCEKVSDQALDQDEFIRYFECTIEEAYELLNQGYIQGGNAKLAFLKAKEYVYRKDVKNEI